MNKTLVISNFDATRDTIIFSNDKGDWNVSRALRDCALGKHKRYTLDVAEAYKGNRAVEVDNAKVAGIVAAIMTGAQCPPALAVVEGGPVWLIDGHHRLRAWRHLGLTEFQAYIIEEADSAPYKIWYNGKRKRPF